MAEDKKKKLTMEELENVAGGYIIVDPRYEEWKNNHQDDGNYVGKFEVGSLSDLLNN